MSPRTIAQMNLVAVDWRNYQTVLWTRETSCVERDVASARATSQMVFTTRAKARISSQVLATIVAKLATRLRSAGPGMELPIPEHITGAMYVMQRQIAELAGQQSSGVATIFLRYSGIRCPLQCFLRGFRTSPLMLVAVRWKKRTLLPSTQACSTRHLGEIQGPH